MKYVDEYRNSKHAAILSDGIKNITTRPWTIMEICGGQTHAIIKYGIDELLPEKITLCHGPGCPVCVTPLESIEKAIRLASMTDVIFCSFGDMLRVPGTKKNLLSVKAEGGDVRIVYSPLDTLEIAKSNPGKKVVFFAVGFETTAPANAMSVYMAKQQNIRNFYMLVSHVLVPPAMHAILSSKDNRVQGFLAAGHVCTVMGYSEYEPIAEKYKIPIVVTGFEPLDILQGLYMCIKQLEQKSNIVENQYSRVVKSGGNHQAREIIHKVFQIINRKWRGIGEIPDSGYGLNDDYESFDAEKVFDLENISLTEPSECISGSILQGVKKPNECGAFGRECTPEHPLGALMVSSEGACAAYYRYKYFHKV